MAKKTAALQWPVMAAQRVDDSTAALEISGSDPTSAWHQEKMLRISMIEVARHG
jgi:hypothetical protein